MVQVLNRISSRVASLFSLIFKINKKQSSNQVINETALFLKDILNYKLAAFVMKKQKGADIWLNQGIHDLKSTDKKSFEDKILKDFNIKNKESLNYLEYSFHPDAKKEKFNVDNLVVYELKDEASHSRLYILPCHNRGNTCYQHKEELNLILQGCTAALSRLAEIKHLTNAAAIDPLTGCYNRREFESQLKRHIAGAIRHKSDLSMFMFDLDHFKKINDTYGHLAGDKVLQEVTSLMQKNMRTGDILARYGGEEFIAVLPETGKIKAMELADRLRIKISKMAVKHNNDIITITASFGVSEMNRHADMARIIQDADTMLYKAKLNGRNIVMPGIFKILSNTEPEKRMQKIV